ncbi:MAG: cation:dicarboxylase symporter family transporter, partial [Erysipelotrichaceae bacterium]|nr:cation:dicarboxylase symporter family transporter [Erysipelotrichaceae bacterium]
MKKSVSLLTLLSLALGVLFGLFFPTAASSLQVVGNLYVDILKIMIAPVLITSISVTAYEMKNTGDHLLFKTVGLFLILFLSTFFFSSLIVLLMDPVLGSTVYSSLPAYYSGTVQEFTLEGFFLSLLPDSFLSLFTGKKLFFLIVLSFPLGVFLRKIRAEKTMELVKKGRDLVYQILSVILYTTPVAVFAISANLVAMNRAVLLSGVWYIL